MNEERKDIWVRYTIYLAEQNSRSFTVVRKMQGALFFLQKAESINRRGYNRFMKDYASHMASNPCLPEGIRHLLNFLGVGFSRSHKPKVAKLEKLSHVSEKNMKKINEFVVFLRESYDYSSSALYLYTNSIKQYFEYATEFDNESCRRYIATLESRGLSPQTIRLRITALEKFGLFVKKPVVLKRPKINKTLHTDNIPTEAEYNRMIDYLSGLPDKRYYILVKLLATTGARVSEFRQFLFKDVLRGEVTLRGKGNKYRQFFFSKSVQDDVRQYIKQYPHLTDNYVCLNRFGERMSDRGINQILKDVGAKCGIDISKMHPHAFRHFFAKMYLKKTKDVVQLAELLGHGSVDTTRIYLQKSHAEQRRDFNRNITW